MPSEYWTIDAELKSAKAHTVKAKFFGTADGKKDLSCEADANEVLAACENGEFTAVSVKRAQKSKSPMPPFTTSSLLQEASKRLGFQSKRIMKVAQELYEGINLGEKFGGSHGIITYMRTDSLRISDEAAEAAREYITGKFGKEYYPPKRRIFKTGEEAQDAHEAIRPADMHFEPDAIKKMLTSDQYKLYKLIWDRFLASQMRNAEFNTLNVEIECGGYIFRSGETAIKFKGYLLAYDDGETELGELYDINEGEKLTLKKLTPKQNFTDPPSHYTEGSLIKVFKEKGIARPSTYASTITTIIDRGYVERDKKLLKSTPLGEAMVELMKKNFPHIVDYKFTANMEDDLDEIAGGKETYEEVLTKFYGDFEKTLEKAQKHIHLHILHAEVLYRPLARVQVGGGRSAGNNVSAARCAVGHREIGHPEALVFYVRIVQGVAGVRIGQHGKIVQPVTVEIAHGKIHGELILRLAALVPEVDL